MAVRGDRQGPSVCLSCMFSGKQVLGIALYSHAPGEQVQSPSPYSSVFISVNNKDSIQSDKHRRNVIQPYK